MNCDITNKKYCSMVFFMKLVYKVTSKICTYLRRLRSGWSWGACTGSESEHPVQSVDHSAVWGSVGLLQLQTTKTNVMKTCIIGEPFSLKRLDNNK